nr:EOG090X06H8 [Sida crystallina]
MTAFLNGLRNESRDVAVSQLLHYLPLLRPANPDAVRGYLHLLPRLLGTFLEEDHQTANAQQQSSELQQLLTYALIHPALSMEHKRSLAELIRQLDDNGGQEVALSLMDANSQGGLDLFQPEACTNDAFHRSHHSQVQHGQWDPWNSHDSILVPPPAAPPPASSSSSSSSSTSSSSAGQRIRRSNSLTPPSNTLSNYLPDLWNTVEDNSIQQRMKPRSQSLSSPIDNAGGIHCPLSSKNSFSSSSGSGSGSDSFKKKNSCPGPEDVPSWLKSLRLHKYAHLFSLLNYEEMLSLTEEQLEAQGVTKGARHKIALSIQRLRERPTLLAQLEKAVSHSSDSAGEMMLPHCYLLVIILNLLFMMILIYQMAIDFTINKTIMTRLIDAFVSLSGGALPRTARLRCSGPGSAVPRRVDESQPHRQSRGTKVGHLKKKEKKNIYSTHQFNGTLCRFPISARVKSSAIKLALKIEKKS